MCSSWREPERGFQPVSSTKRMHSPRGRRWLRSEAKLFGCSLDFATLSVMVQTLDSLVAGMPIPFGGDKVTHVSVELADAFVAGDRMVIVQDTGALLHIPAAEAAIAEAAVSAAVNAFAEMGTVSDDAITAFYRAFADRLESDASFTLIEAANQADIASAQARGRTTTRLTLSPTMRADMILSLIHI